MKATYKAVEQDLAHIAIEANFLSTISIETLSSGSLRTEAESKACSL
jgi:hypothetical protein